MQLSIFSSSTARWNNTPPLARLAGIWHGHIRVSAFANLAEAKILEAIEEGQFLDLKGQGQPLDLDGYFAAPSSLRAGFGVLKSAGLVPPEVEALRYLSSLKERWERSTHAEEKETLRQEIQLRETEVAIALERMKRAMKTDRLG